MNAYITIGLEYHFKNCFIQNVYCSMENLNRYECLVGSPHFHIKGEIIFVFFKLYLYFLFFGLSNTKGIIQHIINICLVYNR